MASHFPTPDRSPTVQVNIKNLIDDVQCYQTVRELGVFCIYLLYVTTSLLWWQAVAGIIGGEIEPRVAHESTAHVATQRGLAERPQHRHPPRVHPVAPLRECHGRRPRLTRRSSTAQAPHREQKRPGGRTREEKRPNRFKFLMMRGPSADPLFASGPWPRHSWMLVGSY